MMRWMLTTVLLTISAAAPATSGGVEVASEESLLKRYAVAQCLARAYPGTPMETDAKAATVGYLEFGNASAEAYEEVTALAAAAATQKYVAKGGEALHVMKCIDLAYSRELQELVIHLLSEYPQ